MSKVVKVTAKMNAAMDAVKEIGGSAFAREVLAYLDEKTPDRTELKTFNAVNATLAAIAGKELMTKAKDICGDKILTKYTLVEVAE